MSQVVCGRKFCTRCGKWRHIYEFGRNPKHSHGLQSWCKTCQRVDQRWRAGVKRRGRPYEQQRRVRTAGIPRENGTWKPAYKTPEYRAYQRERHRRLTAKQRADRQEYQRIYSEGQRRAQGIPPRPLKNKVTPLNTKAARVSTSGILLPAEPFREWLLKELEGVQDLPAWCVRHHVTGDWLYKIRRGDSRFVDVDRVDSVFTARGEPWMLDELYPLEEAA